MLTGEGRLTCVISSRRRMTQTLTAVSSSCRAWRKIDSFPLLLAHDNLFSYDHSLASYCSLNYLPQQRSVRHGTYVQICWHVATLTYDKNILLPFKLLTPRTSLFGRVHQTNAQEAHWRPRRTLTAPTALSFPLWSRGEDALLPAAF